MYHHTKNWDDAEEIADDAFIRLLEQRMPIKNIEHARALVYRFGSPVISTSPEEECDITGKCLAGKN